MDNNKYQKNISIQIKMKKPDTVPIQQERQELMKLVESIHKIKRKQMQYIGNPQKNAQDLNDIFQEKKEYLQSIQKLFNNFYERLKVNSIHYLVFFVGTQTFDYVIECICQIFNESTSIYSHKQMQAELNSKKKELYSLAYLTVKLAESNAPRLVPIFCRNYFRIRDDLGQKLQQITKQETEIKKSKQKQNSLEEFKYILTKVIQMKGEKKKYNNTSINQIFKMVLKHQSRDQRGDDIYEEIALNWIKFQLEDLKKDKQFLCCKTIFFKDEKFQYYRKKYFELKEFTKVQDRPKIADQQLELSQTIAAFMNSKGGVIFLGIVHEQNNFPSVTGFQLEQKYKKDIVKYIRGAVNQVLPKHKCFQMCTEQSQHYYNSAYELNYYISIEFMNLVKNGTFQNCRHPLRSYQKFCICKIAVKMGHPRYLYYVLNNVGNKDNKKQAQIQFISRGQEMNQKETLDKNYDLIYKKLTDYAANKEARVVDEKERMKIHEGCLYDMTMRPEVFFLEDPDLQDTD